MPGPTRTGRYLSKTGPAFLGALPWQLLGLLKEASAGVNKCLGLWEPGTKDAIWNSQYHPRAQDLVGTRVSRGLG